MKRRKSNEKENIFDGNCFFPILIWLWKYGTGTGSTFGSFHTFRMYEEAAIQNGYLNRENDQMSALEQFRNEKENWINLTEFVLNVFKLSPDIKALDMYFKGTKLFNFYGKIF